MTIVNNRTGHECGARCGLCPNEQARVDAAVARIQSLEEALRGVAHIVGGPTTTYAPNIEIVEWRKRAQDVSALIEAALLPATTEDGGE